MDTTIIIATYGDEAWADLAKERALPSVLDFEAEILIGHDDDGTIAGVRNALAAQATGEWLCFLDADDELAPGYLEAMARYAQPNCLLTPRVQRVLRQRQHPPRFYAEVNLLSGNWLIVGTLVERSLFEKVGGFGDYPHGFEDWSLWYKCARVGAQVVKVNRAIYRQFINQESKHRIGMRDREWQIATHLSVQAELEAWTP